MTETARTAEVKGFDAELRWKRTHSRRACLSLALLSLCAACGKKPVAQTEQRENPRAAENQQKRRLVSLSPGITDSLIRLGAGHELVGISDYCRLPETLPSGIAVTSGGSGAPRVGTALAPNYEAIARVEPTLILATEVAGAQMDPLAKLAPTASLPWLELDQVAHSLRRLGTLVNRKDEAKALAEEFTRRLQVKAPKDAPRVLWVLDLGEASSNETWFIRDNSLHGAVLRAAGARNAVTDKVVGPPKLSAEQLLQVNPDAVLMVLGASTLDPKDLVAAQQRLEKHFGRWTPLEAKSKNRLLVVHFPGAMNLGPGVLDLISVIKGAIASLPRARGAP